MIKLIIAEDHQSMIDGIELLLRYEDEIDVIARAQDGEALLDAVRKEQPDVVLTDVKMPKMDGILATRILKREFPDIKILAFSMLAKEGTVLQMVNAGVSGYLLKNSPLDLILLAIKKIYEGGTYFDPSLENMIANNQSGSKTNFDERETLLTKSEKEILGLIGLYKTSSEIAELRFTAISTIEKHRKNMIRKLELSGKNELLRYAIEKKYDELDSKS